MAIDRNASPDTCLPELTNRAVAANPSSFRAVCTSMSRIVETTWTDGRLDRLAAVVATSTRFRAPLLEETFDASR